jgi:hypothetical protein
MAATESMGLNYRRRVIYQALQDTFADARDVRAYFELWQRDHSHEAHFVVTRFASAVAKAAGFDTERKSQFQRRLFHGLTVPYESLPRVPEEWLAPVSVPSPSTSAPLPAASAPPASPPTALPSTAAPPTAAPAAAASGARAPSPERRVFQAFAQPITSALLAKVARQPELLLQAADDLGVGLVGDELALHRQLRRWAESGFSVDNLPFVAGEAALRTLAHHLYLLAADLIGPMQADRLLAQAVAEAERLPEAALFSPQRLL